MHARLSDRIAGVILVALAISYWIIAGNYTVSFGGPAGPSLFPRIIAVPLGILSLYLIVRPDPDPRWVQGAQAFYQLALVVALVVYPLILEPIGFPLATTLITIVLSKILGGRWLPAVICGIVVGFGLYLLFNFVFGLPLPGGPTFV